MASHSWMVISQELVDVIVDPADGKPSVVRRPNESIAEATGCSLCGLPLTEVSIGLPCEPVTEESDESVASPL